MSARSFKSVGSVAAVGLSALACYMLSLQVATERNDLAKIERQIVAAKQQIRSLKTELGTRGRLTQLERWNADVLALSAPVSGQFLRDEFTLARFDQRERSFEERATVRMASAETAPMADDGDEPQANQAPQAPVRMASAAVPERTSAQPTIHRASYDPSPAAPKQQSRPASRIGDELAREIGAAAQAEQSERSGGTR